MTAPHSNLRAIATARNAASAVTGRCQRKASRVALFRRVFAPAAHQRIAAEA